MRHDLYQFESLIKAGSPRQLEVELVRLSNHLGYESIFYSPLIIQQTPEPQFHTQALIPPDQLADYNIFSSYPTSWVMRYQEAGFVRTDPIVDIAVRTHLPIFWHQLPVAQSTHQVFDEARQHGLRSGLSVPIHGAGGEKALLSVATGAVAEKVAFAESHLIGQVYLAAFYLHDAVQTFMRNAAGVPASIPKLSRRERECLLWASQGKTAWEIARILHVSEHTTIFHLKNVRRKLGAVNQHQAIARAISLRIISP